MKKRKPPIVLVTLLVLLVGGVVVFGMRSNATPGDGQETAQGQDGPVMNPSGDQAPSDDELSKNMNIATKRLKPAGKGPQTAPSSGPSIALPIITSKDMPKRTPPKDMGTASQWYNR